LQRSNFWAPIDPDDDDEFNLSPEFEPKIPDHYHGLLPPVCFVLNLKRFPNFRKYCRRQNFQEVTKE
jgi:hypothetical protein